MSFTAINIAEFPIAAWQRNVPKLRSSACVVVDGVPPQEKVVSLCRQAKSAGVEHGMSRVQAEAGSAAVFRARKHDEERAAFATLLEIAERFTPRVEVILSPQNNYAEERRLAVVLLLDSSGIGTLFGTAEQYARRLYAELHAAGFPAGIGGAPNAEAALLLARSTEGVAFADRHSLRGRLARLSVYLLPCEDRMQAVLRRWGIRTLGQLAALPETALISRLGQQGLRLQQLARGDADHLLVPQEGEFTLSETVALDTPVELLDSLLFVLSPMLEDILRKAVERAYALRSVRLTLQLERLEPHSVAVRPATPTQNREVLLKLLNLELQAHPPQSGIVSVTLEAEPTQPQTAQRGLFQAQFPEADKLELLLARLRSIAGEGNVGSPQLQNRHGDDAFTIAAFQPSLRACADKERLPSRLAVRIFRPPQSVRVTCWSDQPRVMFWQGARYVISYCAGPWHASGSWWNGEAWDRDLWDVVTVEPVQALRLRYEHSSKCWFVVGLYD
ncbi:DNA polymerase Y family protein [Terriglobus sp.]|uniref:DNA polymerase Y family protein n=1 Tax=Terriglobus sp. TaxID=1889013 RepID=UPI003B00BCBF